ncbi:hypothetical protein CLIB1423_34S00232 [[Candida] railenensis]|uniref:Uncharacterized protein n=1 Tax=[Candida] railenensis TaxID=45579 RepID=A0A9P0QVD7_9ASCO|nr:hypothetical protein CLIB1423_34S00232 [[Candida] railenensis]
MPIFLSKDPVQSCTGSFWRHARSVKCTAKPLPLPLVYQSPLFFFFSTSGYPADQGFFTAKGGTICISDPLCDSEMTTASWKTKYSCQVKYDSSFNPKTCIVCLANSICM